MRRNSKVPDMADLLATKRRTPWILCAGLLLASIFLFYPQIALLKGSLLTGDHKTQHYPWAWFLDQALSRGSFPWWTWKIHCGFPLLAEGQIGGFYPPNLVLHFLFSANLAYALNFILHLFFSGLFLILYCRQIKLSWPSAAVAALAYLYGNAFGGAYYNFTSLKTLCWFPLSLYLIERLWDRRGMRFGILLGLAFGMQLLAGYLQIAVYAIGMALAYFALRVWLPDGSQLKEYGDTYRIEKQTPKYGDMFRIRFLIRYVSPHFGSRTAGACMGLCIALTVTVLLCFPQFAATFPLSRMSGRVGLQESFAYIGSFPPWGIPTLILPRMQALLRTLGLYVGILPVFLAFLSLGYWKEASIRRWWMMLAVSLLLAMGCYSPLYVALVKITHFYGFRVPSKLLFFSNTALAVLAGWGMEAWLRNAISDAAWKKAKTVFLASAVAIVFFAIVGGWLLDMFKADILKWGYAFIEKNVYGKPYHSHSLDFYRRGVESYFEMTQNLFRLNNPAVCVSLVTAGITILAVVFMRRSWKKSTVTTCCLTLIACDLYAYHFISKMAGDVSTYEKETAPPAAAVFLQKDTSLYRVYGYPTRGQELSLLPSYNMIFGIEDIGAYSPFAMKRYRDLLEGLGAVDDSTGWQVEEPDEAMRMLPLLSVMNVKYIMARREVLLPGLEEVFATATEHIYRNPHVRDRFFFARKAETEKDTAALLAKVRGMDFFSMRNVWLEEDIPSAIALPADGNVRVETYDEGRIVLDVECLQNGLLFASLLHYPGITATVDGVEVKNHRANYCFCAIEVPKGRHRVAFAFAWKKSLGFPGALLKNLNASAD